MFIFDHGQPALLYLVPGVLGATTITAHLEGEFEGIMESKLMKHTEAFWIGNMEEEQKKVDEAKTEAEAKKSD